LYVPRTLSWSLTSSCGKPTSPRRPRNLYQKDLSLLVAYGLLT
jgi:hypothetical protein